MKKKGIKKVVFLPDIHYPEHSVDAMETVKEFCKDFKPDVLIYQGDQLDMAVISHWNKDKKKTVELKRLKSDYDGFMEDIMDPLEKIVGDKCEKVWITGNHEDWVNQYIDKNPALEGIIEPEVCLSLKKRKYKYVPLNGIYKLGKLNVIHGLYCNTYHAAKHVGAFESSVVYAHLHTAQQHTKTSPLDTRAYHSATALPCLCNMYPAYMKDRPSSWVQGFGVAYIMPTGDFSLYSLTMFNNQFAFNGFLYGPKGKTKV